MHHKADSRGSANSRGAIRDLGIDGLSVAGAGNVGGLAITDYLVRGMVAAARMRGGYAPRPVQSLLWICWLVKVPGPG